MDVKIKALHPNFLPPRKATIGAAGYDLCALEHTTVYGHSIAKIPLGFALELPNGYEAQIRGRSSLNSDGMVVLFGTIDADFRGEVSVLIHNIYPDEFFIKPGQRIAQMVIQKLPAIELVISKHLSDTKRGTGSFGSTGV